MQPRDWWERIIETPNQWIFMIGGDVSLKLPFSESLWLVGTYHWNSQSMNKTNDNNSKNIKYTIILYSIAQSKKCETHSYYIGFYMVRKSF